MFKNAKASWNAHTPVWLHNGTKENVAVQLALTVVLVGGIVVKDKIEERRWRREYERQINEHP